MYEPKSGVKPSSRIAVRNAANSGRKTELMRNVRVGLALVALFVSVLVFFLSKK